MGLFKQARKLTHKTPWVPSNLAERRLKLSAVSGSWRKWKLPYILQDKPGIYTGNHNSPEYRDLRRKYGLQGSVILFNDPVRGFPPAHFIRLWNDHGLYKVSLPNARSGHMPNARSGHMPNARSGHMPNVEVLLSHHFTPVSYTLKRASILRLHNELLALLLKEHASLPRSKERDGMVGLIRQNALSLGLNSVAPVASQSPGVRGMATQTSKLITPVARRPIQLGLGIAVEPLAHGTTRPNGSKRPRNRTSSKKIAGDNPNQPELFHIDKE